MSFLLMYISLFTNSMMFETRVKTMHIMHIHIVKLGREILMRCSKWSISSSTQDLYNCFVKLILNKIQMQLTNIDSPRAGLMNHHKPLFIN